MFRKLIEWFKMKLRGDVRINLTAHRGRIYAKPKEAPDNVKTHSSVGLTLKVIKRKLNG